MTTTEIDYVGSELALFANADNWKRYLLDRLGPFLRGRTAEVGAGIGATTRALIDAPAVERWLSIEPDRAQFEHLRGAMQDHALAERIAYHCGTLADFDDDRQFDTIIYIDVLEHIEDDRAEVRIAARHLAPGGKLVVLCPAWPFLFTPFDTAIGHYRRYTKSSLTAVGCADLRIVEAFYMDSVGMLASTLNKVLLRQSMPTEAQVRLWDRVMVPVSRWIDPLLHPVAGKSVVVVWERPPLA